MPWAGTTASRLTAPVAKRGFASGLRPARPLLHGGRRHDLQLEPADEDADLGDEHAHGDAQLQSVTGRKLDKVAMERECTSITMTGLYSNILLALFKFVGGIFGNSMAMVADGVHSLSDLVTDGITLWAARLTHKPQDAGHPYGHTHTTHGLAAATALCIC